MKKIIVLLVVIASLLFSTNVTFAMDSQANTTEWNYLGFSFKSDNGLNDSLKQLIDSEVNERIVYSSYFTGLNITSIKNDLWEHSSDFRKEYVSYSEDDFRKGVSERIKERYTKIVVSERDYDWYKTQINTGVDSKYNCGLATIAMAMKWFNIDNNKSVEEIRQEIGVVGRGISVKTQYDYFQSHNVTAEYFTPEKQDMSFVQKLNGNNIMLVVVDSAVGSTASPEFKSFHSIIINGYFEFEGEEYVTVFDPAGSYVGDTGYNIRHIDYKVWSKYSFYTIVKLDYLKSFIYNAEDLVISKQ